MIDLLGLNDVQAEAVKCLHGPSLIIAGAGSGKTRVLTCKIAYLLDNGVKASEIMALTFTNKAAAEMKERIATMVGREKSRRLKMGTFHSIFARFLRDNAELLGFPKSFTIYDSSDTKNVIKNCIKELGLDDKTYKPNLVAARISQAKNYLTTAQKYMNNVAAIQKDVAAGRGKICEIYSLYAKKCKNDGVMDFDDILLYMNVLLRDFPEVTERLRREITHILVDEYQDTNRAQYEIVKKLASGHKNITVVGDDSQSIYAFRGAKIENILNFKKDYPEAYVYRLEQNYRSTQTIVLAANSLISHNENRLKKECFSKGESGEKIELISAFNEADEAQAVVFSISRRIYKEKAPYSSFAILYRVNSQSRAVEEALRKRNIPYKIYKGHSFYERKEVKDLLAYMRLVINHADNDAFRRIVNIPARGIGDTTMERLSKAASEYGISLWDAVSRQELESYGLKPATISKLRGFVDKIALFASRLEYEDAYTLAQNIVEQTGLAAALNADTTMEGISRQENVNELLNGVREFVVQEKELAMELGEADSLPGLERFMENVALLTDADEKVEQEDDNKVRLMTVHASKGLEFPYVYIMGMEENLFPSSMAQMEVNGVEEERRLCYVALTRAEKAVSISFTKSRFLNGKSIISRPSRFLHEIDPRYMNGTVPSSGEGLSMGTCESSSWERRREDVRTPSDSRSPILTRIKDIPKSENRSPVSRDADPICGVDLFSAGDRVFHLKFGEGVVMSSEGTGSDAKAVIKFSDGSVKTLLLKYARLQRK